MKNHRKKSKRKRILIGVILTVLFVGGAELMVCRIVSPAIYDQITASVRDWLHQTGNTLSASLQGISSRFSRDDAEETPEEFQSQVADQPSIELESASLDPKVTALENQDGINYLTGGAINMVYYRQSAPEWADKKYGSDPIGPYGCGPTAMAMLVSSLTEQSINPEQMSKWAADNGYWVSRSGSRLSLIPDAAAAYGLQSQPLRDFRAQTLLQELSSGKLAVALMTTGHFTKNGHFIVLRGATLDGRILVADPNSEERSLVTWDPQLILDELSPSRDSGAPLWLIYP